MYFDVWNETLRIQNTLEYYHRVQIVHIWHWKLNTILFMLLAFKSAENLTAIPQRFSLNKDCKTDSDTEVKWDLWISLGVWNKTLLHPDLNFPFWGVFLHFHLCIIHQCIYKIHFEPTFFPPYSTLILNNRLNPNVFNGCLDNKTADTKLIFSKQS